MDRRNRKSQQVLQEGLFALLQQIPYDQISIQAITDAADTARVTFYRHYGSKDELLLAMVKNFYQRLTDLEQSSSLSFDDLLNFDNIPPIFVGYSILNENRLVVKNILQSPAQNFLRKILYQESQERVIKAFHKSPHYADLPIEFIASHIATVNVGYTFWWVTEDFPYSVDYVARLTHYAGICGALKMLGRDELIKMPESAVWDFSAPLSHKK